MMNFDLSSSRETCVRRVWSRIEDIDVSATRGYSSDEASSSGGEASLRSRGVMREVLKGASVQVLSFRDKGPSKHIARRAICLDRLRKRFSKALSL